MLRIHFAHHRMRSIFETSMSLPIRLGLLLPLVALMAASVQAGPEGYVCTVSSFSHLTAEGTLNSDPQDPFIGQQFTVDRQSGKIIGKHVSSRGFKTEVLEYGSTSQSFKMLGRSPGFLHILYMEILEFSEASLKPFVLVDGSRIYSGRCG
jgi:hypothetical protein